MTTVNTSRRRLLRWGIAGAAIVAVMAVAVTIASVSGIAWAANSGSAASDWHIGYYTPSGRTLSFAVAPAAASNGIASLNFTNEVNTALLVTENKAKFPSLLGDLAGKSVTASFTVSGLNAGQSFNYYGQPSCGGTTAYVRYFFETSNAGGFDETHYWWSNPVDVNLTKNGSATLDTVSFDGRNWSDFYGNYGTDTSAGSYAAAFNTAVSNVTMIGLSFGGGCFFESGIGTTDGSGTFTLNAFDVK